MAAESGNLSGARPSKHQKAMLNSEFLFKPSQVLHGVLYYVGVPLCSRWSGGLCPATQLAFTWAGGLLVLPTTWLAYA